MHGRGNYHFLYGDLYHLGAGIIGRSRRSSVYQYILKRVAFIGEPVYNFNELVVLKVLNGKSFGVQQFGFCGNRLLCGYMVTGFNGLFTGREP